MRLRRAAGTSARSLATPHSRGHDPLVSRGQRSGLVHSGKRARRKSRTSASWPNENCFAKATPPVWLLAWKSIWSPWVAAATASLGLAAVGLLASENSGRVVFCDRAGRDAFELAGCQEAQAIYARGVDDIVVVDDNRRITEGSVYLAKRLRPNLRHGRIVLYVSRKSSPEPATWEALLGGRRGHPPMSPINSWHHAPPACIYNNRSDTRRGSDQGFPMPRGRPAIRSSISSRIMRTKSGWLPTVAARTMFSPSCSAQCLRLRCRDRTESRCDRTGSRSARSTTSRVWPVGVQRAQRVADVGLEPGLLGRAAAALIGQLIVAMAQAPRKPAGRLPRIAPRSRRFRPSPAGCCAPCRSRAAAARRSAGICVERRRARARSSGR